MKLITFRSPALRLGVLDGEDVFVFPKGVQLSGLLTAGGQDAVIDAGTQARKRSRDVRPVHSLDLGPSVPAPPTIRDFMTFEQHVVGTGKMLGLEIDPLWYEIPTFYFTNPGSLHGDGDDVRVSPGSELFDLELEVAIVIGQPVHNATVEEARSSIAGYTIMNDWSARDLQWREMSLRLGPAKGKDGATSLGPTFVTADEFEQRYIDGGIEATMTATINGTVLGVDNLQSMHFSFAQMVSYASRGATLRPGDVLGSGTSGMGCLAEKWGREGRDSQRPLAAGDVVSLHVEGLGSLTNRVVPAEGVHPIW